MKLPTGLDGGRVYLNDGGELFTLRTTSTPQHAGEWSLQCVKGVYSFFWRAASRIARISSSVASGTSDRSSIRSETSATR